MISAVVLGVSLLVGTLGGPGPNGLIGTWTCTSASLSQGTWTFTRPSPTTLSLSGEFDETFRLNRQTHRWTWASKTAGATGAAGPWNSDDSWTFDGYQRGQGPIRMIFTNLTDNTFHREIDTVKGDQLFQSSASACSRAVTK